MVSMDHQHGRTDASGLIVTRRLGQVRSLRYNASSCAGNCSLLR